MDQNRRKFIRYNIPLDVEFKLLDNASSYSTGLTTNFSRSGLCFSSVDSSPSLNEAIDLKIKMPDSDEFTSAVGDLVWKQESDNECLYGVKLMAMEADAKSVILERAYNTWLEKMRA